MNEHLKEKGVAQQVDSLKQPYNDIKDDSIENQNKGHNVRKEALGPNTRRKK